ncbi:hypothetical protein HOLDEFILI_00488 [Holdemania filiformis DSM 12042]|uniref:Uncharacterized protein n=1 Tax=Holdemania filiformis DSM 12042 TaxID=545696 RepID=B9Y3V8_9FIRM|nr:hypothetical protein HOLDEFILI_00488 [Holdemania filiformis DSM 12042]
MIKEIKSPVLSEMKAAGLLSVILPLLDQSTARNQGIHKTETCDS